MNELKPKHKGAHAQLTATLWLLEQGYDVFENCSDHGLADLVGWKDGLFSLFDVKTRDAKLPPRRYDAQANGCASGAHSLSAEQVAQGVKLLLVGIGVCTICA